MAEIERGDRVYHSEYDEYGYVNMIWRMKDAPDGVALIDWETRKKGPYIEWVLLKQISKSV